MYHNPAYSLEVVQRGGTCVPYDLDKMQTNTDAQQASSGVIDLFVDAVTTGAATPLDAEDVLDSMRVVFACVASNESRAQVDL